MNKITGFKLSALFITLLTASATVSADMQFENMSLEGATGLEDDVYPDMPIDAQNILATNSEYVMVESEDSEYVSDALINMTCSWPEDYPEDNYISFGISDVDMVEIYEISELEDVGFEVHDNDSEIGDNYISFTRIHSEAYALDKNFVRFSCGLHEKENVNETGLVSGNTYEADIRVDVNFFSDFVWGLKWPNNVTSTVEDGATFYEEDTIVLNSYDWFSNNYSINYDVNGRDYSIDYSHGLYNATLEHLDSNKTEEIVIPYGTKLETGNYRFNASYHVPMGFNNSGGLNKESVTFKVLDEHERVQDEDVIEIIDNLIMIALIMILYGAATNMNKLKRVTRVD